MIDVPVLVKDALRDGRMKKNFRILVLNDDETTDFVIDNNTLVKESVNIDERMCSGDDIKYGLCEGSSLEFQYFDHENIVGRRLQVFIDAQYLAGRIAAIDEDGSFTVPADGTYDLTITQGDATGLLITKTDSSEIYVDFVLGQTTDTEDLETGDVVTINGGSDGTRLEIFASDVSYPIPMGFFTVKKCSRQASTGIIKVTAYNKLMSEYLDAKANLLLLDILKGDEPVSMFDIRSLLLTDFKITEDRSELGTIDYPPMTVIDSVAPDFGTFKFNSLYGKKSPINAYEFGVSSTSTTFGIRGYGDIAEYGLTARCQIDALYGSLRGLEENVVKFLKKIINDADLDKDWDDTLDYICTHDGFQFVFGVRKYTGSTPDGYVYYSTVQWEYEEAHGLAHTVAGTIMDAQRLTTTSEGIDGIVPGFITKSGSSSNPWIHLDGTLEKFYPMVKHDYYEYYTDSSMTTTAAESMPYVTFSDGTKYQAHDNHLEHWAISAFKYENISPADLVTADPDSLPDFTLREIQSAVFETICEFGQLSRETDLFSGVELNHERLYPADTLYPADDLYPGGGALSGFKSLYSKLWADEGNVRKWRYLIITYKGLDSEDQEKDYTLQKTINPDGTDDYNMSDNWIFRNLIWTKAQVETYAEAMKTKMQYLRWFPFEMWAAGLPYLETGDEIEIPLNEVTYTSYILRRQLKGIQNLQDTYINGVIDIY